MTAKYDAVRHALLEEAEASQDQARRLLDCARVLGELDPDRPDVRAARELLLGLFMEQNAETGDLLSLLKPEGFARRFYGYGTRPNC